MERVIDLDQAAAVIAERAARWSAAGLTVGEVTWRDADAPWPQRLETDRALVRDPDSVGVLVSRATDAELSVVLFRGGWVDVDFFAGLDEAGLDEAGLDVAGLDVAGLDVAGLDVAGPLPGYDIDSAAEFGIRLDRWTSQVFGNPRDVRN